MKKFLMMVLCLGMCFAAASCSLGTSGSSSNMSESSGCVDNSSEIPDESTDNGSGDSSDNSTPDDSGVTDDSTDDSIGDDSTGDDSTEDDSSVIAPPIIDGENEMPLVPVG